MSLKLAWSHDGSFLVRSGRIAASGCTSARTSNFTVSQWILGDYSVMAQTRSRPHYLVEMHDAVYATNMRELFKNLWEEVK